MIAPRATQDYPLHTGGQVVIVTACDEHVIPVRIWSEDESLDGTALVMRVEDLHRNYAMIFGGIDTPVLRLERHAG